jgi:hypothetical protein
MWRGELLRMATKVDEMHAIPAAGQGREMGGRRGVGRGGLFRQPLALASVEDVTADGKRISYDVIGYGEWIRPRMRDFRAQCCDCGLIHRLDFRIVDEGRSARAPKWRSRPSSQSDATSRPSSRASSRLGVEVRTCRGSPPMNDGRATAFCQHTSSIDDGLNCLTRRMGGAIWAFYARMAIPIATAAANQISQTSSPSTSSRNAPRWRLSIAQIIRRRGQFLLPQGLSR